MSSNLSPGPTTDATVAEKVMGLTIVAMDWPSGYLSGGCWKETATFVVKDGDTWIELPGREFFSERLPVTASRHADGKCIEWPPVLDDDKHSTEIHYACVRLVPEYSTDITAAWVVVKVLIEKGFHVYLDSREGSWRVVVYRTDLAVDYFDICIADVVAETAPLAICLAALEAISG